MLNHLALVKAAQNLAPLPATVTRLASLMVSEDRSVAEVEAIVRLDGPLTGRLIQFANSAAMTTREPAGTVKDAILRVGMGPVLTLAMAAAVQRDFMRAVPEYGLSEGALWRHAVGTALAAELVARQARTEVSPESFTAAILHDVGKLTLARFLDSEQLRWMAAARLDGHESVLTAEREILGVDHAELGGLIAANWKLPPRLVGGITHHHDPDTARDTLCDVVHVANALAKRAGTGHTVVPEDLEAEAGARTRLGLGPETLDTMATDLAGRLEETVGRFG